ncbi:MAG TPA: GNAT family N-acetyltransferase [Candidatus Hydrogenedentes bacterium]|nr:GNAT family N-acetyltransferase [Candidatus Hydrogenedentota bacterium]HQH52322.1 GNAT family N-acetyltransferase [Candidatus Hydrogenedentota bacterium]HQM47424.1 GNAT family N-acetyltransferase [Candidatus Hydrogenedentota bacterium]
MKVEDDIAGHAALIRPTVALETAFLEAAWEYRNVEEELDPGFPVYWTSPFDAYVGQLEALVSGKHMPVSMVPADTFWLVSPEMRFLGMSRLRHRLTRQLRIEGGHIGYTIRPSERRKGYGTRLCALTVEEARKTGRFKRLLITCDTNNTGSARIIEKNGGVLENYVVSPRGGYQVSRYWVTL